MNSKLIFIQLNEINFELVYKYINSANKKKFTNLRYLKKNFKNFETFAEDKYENIEPWIQWASVHLGKNYKSHQIFRLGDIVNHPEMKQIFEKIEEKGFKVSVTVVDQLLEKHNFRPRQAFKVEAGKKNIPQRDEQFKNIERLKQEYTEEGNPVLSMDVKKRN